MEIRTFYKKHTTVVITVAVVVLLLAGIASRALKHPVAKDTSGNSKPVVSLLNARDYGQNSHTVSANGTVESLQQADLRSQATGKITKINVSVGQQVTKDQVLATLDQSAASAAVTSARGSLNQAQANYQRVLAGASSEQISVTQASVNASEVALENAKTSLKNTIAQQATAVTNAQRALLNSGLAAIPASGNLDSAAATVTGTYAGTAEGDYVITIYNTGSGQKFQFSGLESGSGDVHTTPVPLGTQGLNIQFSTAPSSADKWTVSIPNMSAASYQANYNAYQSALQTQTSAIAGVQAQVDSSQTALSQAQAQLVLQQAQARPADIAAAQAGIVSAQGQVQAATAAYENTIIRAPFNGTISALPVKFADLVTAGSNVMTIVNQGGLQVKVFVSNEDLASVHVGGNAKIGPNGIAGTVTNAAPSVDAASKTAEVDVAIADPSQSGLTIGQNTNVLITGADTSATSDSFLLPLQAVKITPDGKNYVYTLDANGKAQEISVTIGKVDGEHVQVTGGIQEDMKILSNAYGVSAGDSVTVQ